MGKAKRSLREYAESNPLRAGSVCWACSIPESDELNKAYRTGVRIAQIMGWLIAECGHNEQTVTHNKLKHHFGERHHLRG